MSEYQIYEIFTIFITSALFIAIFYYFIYLSSPTYKRKVLSKQPVITCTGKVIEKYMITVSQFRNARSIPHISFETVNGERLDIELENFQYALVRNNEKVLCNIDNIKETIISKVL